MRRLISILSLLFISTCSNAKIEVVIHVDDSYQPYSYLHEGRVQGLYIDIIEAAFSKLDNYSVKFEPVPWSRGKHLMETGDGFALAPAYFHAHDWPWLYPYTFPLYEETVSVICNSQVSKTDKLQWPEDFVGKTIGSIRGFDGWGGPEFRQMLQKNMFDYHEVDNADLLIMMVASGRNHCILMEKFTFDYHMRNLLRTGQYDPEKSEPLFEAAIAGRDYGYIGFSDAALATDKYPWQKDFQKALDGELYLMKKSGELAKIASDFLH